MTTAAVTEGKTRAAEVRARMTEAHRAAADAMTASVPDKVRRMFVGPPNAKGRQAAFFATDEEMLEFSNR